jgi:hypothetical protein
MQMPVHKVLSLGVALFALLLGAFGTTLVWKADAELRENHPNLDYQQAMDFDRAFRQYRLSGAADIVTACGALAATLGIYLSRRWGRFVLAAVICAHAIFYLGYRFLPGPRYVPVSRGYALWFMMLSGIVWWWAFRHDARARTAS